MFIDSLEKDKHHLQEQLAGVRSEKDALEAVLFDTANMLEDSDNKRTKLEQELQETLVQQENYKGNIHTFLYTIPTDIHFTNVLHTILPLLS